MRPYKTFNPKPVANSTGALGLPPEPKNLDPDEECEDWECYTEALDILKCPV